MSLTLESVHAIIERIDFRPSCVDMGWEWSIEEVFNRIGDLRGFIVAVSFQRPDTHTGIMSRGWSGPVFLPLDTDETRIVMKCWNCIELVVRHELMESYSYLGERVLNPHKTIEQLVYPATLRPR
jgi:hypothetical protein